MGPGGSLGIRPVSGSEYGSQGGGELGPVRLGVQVCGIQAVRGGRLGVQVRGAFVRIKAGCSGRWRLGIQVGGIQSGSIQSGGIQSGAIQSGAIQSGAIQSGGIQSGAIQSGAIQSGAIQSGGIEVGGIEAVRGGNRWFLGNPTGVWIGVRHRGGAAGQPGRQHRARRCARAVGSASSRRRWATR